MTTIIRKHSLLRMNDIKPTPGFKEYVHLNNSINRLRGKLENNSNNTVFLKDGKELLERAETPMAEWRNGTSSRRNREDMEAMKLDIDDFISLFNQRNGIQEQPSKRRRAMSRSVSTPSCLIL